MCLLQSHHCRSAIAQESRGWAELAATSVLNPDQRLQKHTSIFIYYLALCHALQLAASQFQPKQERTATTHTFTVVISKQDQEQVFCYNEQCEGPEYETSCPKKGVSVRDAVLQWQVCFQ